MATGDDGDRDYFVHESSFVDEPCTIGKGTRIWHFCHIMASAAIGRDCNIGQNVVLSPGCVIGDNVKIQNNVSVYTGVILEDDVFCGPSAVFTNVVNPRSHVDRKHEYRQTLVKRGATIGANRSEEHTSELQSLAYLVCRLLLEKKKKKEKYECINEKSRKEVV